MIFLLQLLEPAEQPMAGPSSCKRKIVDIEDFQNCGGMEYCIIFTVLRAYRTKSHASLLQPNEPREGRPLHLLTKLYDMSEK